VICKTARETLENMRALLDFPQQQSATVGTDLAAVELTHHYTASKAVKFQLTCSTLCLHKAAALWLHN
jgi:hypothetical protein